MADTLYRTIDGANNNQDYNTTGARSHESVTRISLTEFPFHSKL
jgi:hypothetical protein